MTEEIIERRLEILERSSKQNKGKKMGLLKDDGGKTSSMRVMSFISLFASIWFGYMSISLTSENGLWLAGLFLIAAFAPKALQKISENEKFLGARPE